MVDTSSVRRDERTGGRSQARDNGSSLIEQLIAISVITAVLLGLLASLGATATSVSTGRQRTIAVSLAKQAIENMQGAAYPQVAMDMSTPELLSELLSDPLVKGTTPDLRFENDEPLVEGKPLIDGVLTPFSTTVDGAGTKFTIRTYVTSVPADTPGGGPYRRVTIVIDWNTAGTVSTSAQRTMRFSSLVFPLDYKSYPASSGSAEAIGASLTLTGTLAGETFDELRLALPSTHATTNSSTLRTAIASAAGSTSTVALLAGAVTSTCLGYSDGAGWECPRETAASVADNDTLTKTDPSEVNDASFVTASTSTPVGTTVHTPAGNMTSRATVSDADLLPRSEASLTPSGGAITQIKFQADGFGWTLWKLDDLWEPSATVDHDDHDPNTDEGGVVNATADLVAPAARMLDFATVPAGFAVPEGFTGAVRVSGFTASASVTKGYATAAQTATTGASVEIWDGSAYLPVLPGQSATAEIALIGDHRLEVELHVQSQPATTSTPGESSQSQGVAQHPSLLLVTAVVTVIKEGLDVETFTIVFDYGRVSASATWLEDPA